MAEDAAAFAVRPGAVGPRYADMAVDVILCTFRRPSVVATLRSLAAQGWPGRMRVIVVDNDDVPSARERVLAAGDGLDLLYFHAPARNISLARNAGLERARAPWIAFIDDDEEAAADWLERLAGRAAETGADGVFGPALAHYPPDTPAWAREGDFHSNRPERRGEVVETGHTCNALLRWHEGAPWQDLRFDLARGRAGGEDTEFFFRMHAAGARFEIAEDAIVHEPTPPARLSLRWLARRRFRMGQSYASVAWGPAARASKLSSSAAKAGYCTLRTLLSRPGSPRQIFWGLRGVLHLGICAGCVGLREPQLYGG